MAGTVEPLGMMGSEPGLTGTKNGVTDRVM